MLCTHPGILKDAAGMTRRFNCGQCTPCRITKQSMWAGRILLESRLHRHSTFITLTYSNETVPRHPANNKMTLSKRHTQLFFKRLRSTQKNKIRYFICGEYGSGTVRPHYHAILFGHPSSLTETLQRSWNLGFISCSDFNPHRARYVAKYTMKIQSGSLADPWIEQPFALQSKKPPLGHDYLHHVATAALQSPSPEVPSLIRIDGSIYNLDYFTRKTLSRLMEIPMETETPIRSHLQTEKVVILGDPLMVDRQTSTMKAWKAEKLADEKAQI